MALQLELMALQLAAKEVARPPPTKPVSNAAALKPAEAAERAAAITADPRFFKRPANEPTALAEYAALVAEHAEMLARASEDA